MGDEGEKGKRISISAALIAARNRATMKLISSSPRSPWCFDGGRNDFRKIGRGGVGGW